MYCLADSLFVHLTFFRWKSVLCDCDVSGFSRTSVKLSAFVSFVGRGAAIPARLHVPTAKTPISMRIRTVWSEYSQDTVVAKDPKRLQADLQGGAGWYESSLGTLAILCHDSIFLIFYVSPNCPIVFESSSFRLLPFRHWFVPFELLPFRLL